MSVCVNRLHAAGLICQGGSGLHVYVYMASVMQSIQAFTHHQGLWYKDRKQRANHTSSEGRQSTPTRL